MYTNDVTHLSYVGYSMVFDAEDAPVANKRGSERDDSRDSKRTKRDDRCV